MVVVVEMVEGVVVVVVEVYNSFSFLSSDDSSFPSFLTHYSQPLVSLSSSRFHSFYP
ncbi:hypothetical protein E2C01_065205 [Portunus trituberculatus]|uniref:Uncharacterized protein n=1 Tax=Portunus trituberculatus TaxID=210409 RepID=A0A5B7HF08_PORTR|nr:hypothetical protein [Portunus trituberculatus]